ncbi:MAG: hypothetical protein FWF15_01775 [Oscillospiraceae bacterium]|nr:hypothetical protein [Oscillospiraceae bacterium]
MEDRVIASPIKAIRKHCLECGGGSFAEARNCPAVKCILHPYRFGITPKSKRYNAVHGGDKKCDCRALVLLYIAYKAHWSKDTTLSHYRASTMEKRSVGA